MYDLSLDTRRKRVTTLSGKVSLQVFKATGLTLDMTNDRI